jgi:hypothetical protein
MQPSALIKIAKNKRVVYVEMSFFSWIASEKFEKSIAIPDYLVNSRYFYHIYHNY